jgi:SAM-dependent methyltransferase
MSHSPENEYGKGFYDTQSTGSARSARRVLPLVCEWVRPSTAIDVGSGVGTWVAELLRLGVDAIGIDGDWVRDDMLAIPADRFRRANLETLTPEMVGRTFDLAISLEVAEHLSPAASERFVELLTRVAPVVLFSAAIPGQGGTHHVNERWQSFWGELFVKRGFHPFDTLRPRVRGNGEVDWWYRQNVVMYATHSAAERFPASVRAAEATVASLDIVDPVLYRVATSSSRRMLKNLARSFWK